MKSPLKNFISPHTHCETSMTGSIIDNLVKKAASLERTHFSYTDHNTFSGLYKAYNAAKKKGMGFIPGVELYFKDDNCDIIQNTDSQFFKYFKTTVYFRDQESFQAVANITRNERPEIEIRGDQHKLFSWADLKEIAKHNVVFATSDFQDLISKNLIVGNKKSALEAYKRLAEIAGKDNLYITIIPHRVDKSWYRKVKLTLENGQVWVLDDTDTIDTNSFKGVSPSEAHDKPNKHHTIKSLTINSIFYTVNSRVEKAEIIEDFYPIDGDLDLQKRANIFMYMLAKRYDLKVLVSDYAYFAEKEDKVVQNMKLETTKFSADYYMLNNEEAIEYMANIMGITIADAEKIIMNSFEFAKLFDSFELKYEYRLPKHEGDSLKITQDIIEKTGRKHLLKDPVYRDRLKLELGILKDNGILDLLPYFFPIRDVLNYYKENGELTGPSRGSAGGCLLMYLMGITQLDPIKYNLPFERFFSMDRIQANNLPDVDVDLPHRELLVGEEGYLTKVYGDKWGQVSTRSLLKIKSAIKDVSRYVNGKVTEEAEKISKALPAPPQGVSGKDAVFGFEDSSGAHVPGLLEQSDALQEYAANNPREWNIITHALGVPRQISRHASAFIIADEDLNKIVPMMGIKEANKVTQWEAGEIEKAGLIKYDFLCVSQLKDIGECLKYINKKNGSNLEIGTFNHKGEDTYIWDIPVDMDAFKEFYEGATETTFQTNTKSMFPFVKRIKPKNIMDCATILALVRPGPLDFIDPATGRSMAEEYMWRREGRSEPQIKELAELLPDTYGIIVFQEDITKIAAQLAGFSGQDAEDLRKYMCKKKKKEMMMMKPAFIEGALKTVSEEVANAIWEQMETFAQYGFSIIHSVGYAMITYACIFLKYNYKLEWWAAVLSNAKDKEINEELWKYVKDIVAAPDINLSREHIVIDYKNNKLRSKLSMITGLGEKAIQPIMENRPYKDIRDFVQKEVCGISMTNKLAYIGVLDSLFEPNTPPLDKLQQVSDLFAEKAFYKKVTEKAKEIGIPVPKEALESKDKLYEFCQQTAGLNRLAPCSQGNIDEKYAYLSSLEDFKLKKSILPSMPLSLLDCMIEQKSELIKKSKSTRTGSSICAINSRGKETAIINGKKLRFLDERIINKDFYFAVPVYVHEAKVFDYSGGRKKALKLIVDADGYISEKVLWPNYTTQQLEYPETLKKGATALMFFSKKEDSEYTNINDIYIIE